MSVITKAIRNIRHRRAGIAVRSGAPEEAWRKLIRQFAPGRTFLDVGCMWNVHGAYAFLASDVGATRVVGLDVAEPSVAFVERNSRAERPIRFVRGDVMSDDVVERIDGPAEVVFCAGVLYHMPNPLLFLDQLRLLCQQTLILATASVLDNGTPQTAVFVPGLEPEAQRRLGFYSAGRKIALETEYDADRGYGNWFWLPSTSCVAAMLRATQWTVDDVIAFRHVTTIVARPAPTAMALS